MNTNKLLRINNNIFKSTSRVLKNRGIVSSVISGFTRLFFLFLAVKSVPFLFDCQTKESNFRFTRAKAFEAPSVARMINFYISTNIFAFISHCSVTKLRFPLALCSVAVVYHGPGSATIRRIARMEKTNRREFAIIIISFRFPQIF